MKKFFLVIFILVDLVVIAACSLFLFSRFKNPSAPLALPSGIPFPQAMVNTLRPTPNPTPTPAPTPNPTATPPANPTAMFPAGMIHPPSGSSTTVLAPGMQNTRKILFAYRNSKAKKVMIRADFTGWHAEPMQKGLNSIWQYTVPLEPGEYAYLFSIDNKKPIRDPANKRTKQVGKSIASSIVVTASPAAPPH